MLLQDEYRIHILSFKGKTNDLINLKGKSNLNTSILGIKDLYVNTELTEILNKNMHDLLRDDEDWRLNINYVC